MKIGFFGGGPQALAVLERVVADPSREIAFVHPRWADDPIATDFAPARGIPVMSIHDINSPEALAYIRASGADLLLSVNAKQIFKADLLAVPRLGAINLHNGLLPRQRGGGGAYAAMINGEPNGCTVHFIDPGVDSGPIIMQQVFDLSEKRTMGDVMAEAIRRSPDVAAEALSRIAMGKFEAVSQSGMSYYYVPSKPDWDELIDWARPTEAILARLRARTPGPRGTYILDGALWRVVDFAEEPLLAAHENAPGQVLARRKDFGVLIKTGDTGFWITRAEPADGGHSFTPNYKVGTLLRQNLDREVFELKRRLTLLETKLMRSE